MVDIEWTNRVIQKFLNGNRAACETDEERALYDDLVREQQNVKETMGPGVGLSIINESPDFGY